jgi:hypothetical protein
LQRRDEGVVEVDVGERSGIEADGKGNHGRVRKVALFDERYGVLDALIKELDIVVLIVL